jgi:Protein of unknown function (DUF559)
MGGKCSKVECKKCHQLISSNNFRRHFEIETRKCHCGKFLTSRQREFCSKRCAQIGKRYAGTEHAQKIGDANKLRQKWTNCLNCSRLFPSSRKHYCSVDCSNQSPLRRRKLRIAIIQRRFRNGWNGWCAVGRHETQLLDLQEKLDRCNIQRQFLIKDLGYIVDGYCHETNTVYEVYEPHHVKQEQHDRNRQTEICRQLNCNFKIIKDNY